MPRRNRPAKRPRRKKPTKTKTHYEILSVKPSATHDEILTAYQSAILEPSSDAADGGVVESKSLKIQKAWDILGDPKSRSDYDNELRLARRRRNARVYDEVMLIDMVPVVVEEGGVMTEFKLIHRCKCEYYYCEIDSKELEKMGYRLVKGNCKVWFQAMEEPVRDYPPSSLYYSSDDDGENGFNTKCLGKVVVPCERCPLGVRLSIDPGLWTEYGTV